MLRPKPPQTSFYGSYLYDRIIPADHLLRKINQVVDFSFVTDLVQDRYTAAFGRPAEDPEFMLRLCLLQYLYGDSDRKVVENARVNLAYKFFLGLAVDEAVPDDTTICHFRSVRLGEEIFRKVFENVVRQCIDNGLVTGKRQIVDSTHIVADMAVTSLTGLITLCRRNLIREVSRQDGKVAERLAPEPVVDTKETKFTRMEEGLEHELAAARTLLSGVTDELRNGNLKVTDGLKANLQLLEKAVADREGGAVDRLVSPIDADARLGKKESKTWAGYKGHVVVEEDSEIITAVETTPGNRADGNQLESLLEQQKEAFARTPQELSADKAYGAGANLELLDSKGIAGYVSLSAKVNNVNPDFFTVEDFHYDPVSDTLTCPGGCSAVYHRRATFHTARVKRNGYVFQFSPQQCRACDLKHRCHKENRGRAVAISYYQPYHRQMQERMAGEAGREAYRNRYRVEHKIADLARYCGMRRCRYRGLERARVHTLLAAIVSNVKRMARLLWKPPDGALPGPARA